MGELAAGCSRGDGGVCARAGDVPDDESGRGGGRCVHRACTQQGRGVLQSGGDLLKARRPGGALTGRGRVWPEGGAANRGGRGGVLRRPGEAAAVADQRAAVGSASGRGRQAARWPGQDAPERLAARQRPGADAAGSWRPGRGRGWVLRPGAVAAGSWRPGRGRGRGWSVEGRRWKASGWGRRGAGPAGGAAGREGGRAGGWGPSAGGSPAAGGRRQLQGEEAPGGCSSGEDVT
jgi:translation initiation factor IF-2